MALKAHIRTERLDQGRKDVDHMSRIESEFLLHFKTSKEALSKMLRRMPSQAAEVLLVSRSCFLSGNSV